VRLRLLWLLLFFCIFLSTGIYVDLPLGDSGQNLTLFKVMSLLLFGSMVVFFYNPKINQYLKNYILVCAAFFLLLLKAKALSSALNILLLFTASLVLLYYYTILKITERLAFWKLIFLFLVFQGVLEMLLIPIGTVDEGFFSAIVHKGIVRIDGWATEPSHYSFLICFCLSCYYSCFRILRKRVIMLLVPVLVLVVMTWSAFGFVFFIFTSAHLLFNKVKVKERLSIKKVISISVFTIVIIFAFAYTESGGRVIQSVAGFINLEADTIDGTARVRLLPLIVLFKGIANFDLISMVFGHGLGESKDFIKNQVGINTFEGHITSFIYDFGIAGLVWLFILVRMFITKNDNNIFILLMFILMMFNMNVGTQIFWVSILLMGFIKFETEKRNFRLFQQKFSEYNIETVKIHR